jgi:hypothetical protein
MLHREGEIGMTLDEEDAARILENMFSQGDRDVMLKWFCKNIDATSILNTILEIGDAGDISMWCFDHICCDCEKK